jgi:hypothetical protein
LHVNGRTCLGGARDHDAIRGLSRVDRVVAALDARDRNVVPRSRVRVWVAVAVLPAASVVATLTAKGRPEPAGWPPE